MIRSRTESRKREREVDGISENGLLTYRQKFMVKVIFSKKIGILNVLHVQETDWN